MTPPLLTNGRVLVLIIAALTFIWCLELLLDSDLFVLTGKQTGRQGSSTGSDDNTTAGTHNDLLESRYANFSAES